MVDPTVRLALALYSNRGAYAVLLGSGISAAAGIPTGWQIVSDLASKIAVLDGANAGDDPIGWYRRRFGREPDYSTLLEELAKSPTERNMLLRKYFEPSDDDRRSGLKVPSAAHRALGRMAAKGYISIFLTTNFDRLLEQGLEAAGVVPTVLSSPDSFAGAVPLGQIDCTVIKLNGDYLDTRIKNTPIELESYDPSIDRLLDRVLDEYGLIVSGWSADWDTALCRAFERCHSHRYTTFWASRNQPRETAARLIDLRQAEFVRIKDPDSLFTDIEAKLVALGGASGKNGQSVPGATVPPPVRQPESGDIAAATLTFLFTDLEGSTHLWETFPEAMKGALERHDAILRAAVGAAGGRVVKSTGNGTMAVFGSAVDAARACLEAQRALAKEPWAETGPLRVRMGVHTGQAENRAGDFFGPTVNRTARIMAAGHGGQVLFSSSAAALVLDGLPEGASLLELGTFRLKDLARPEHLFQMVHTDLASGFPPLTHVRQSAAGVPARAAAFIGRQAELEQIEEGLHDPSVRLLTLVGPGGTGKTTLAIRAAGDAASGFADGVSFVDLSSARDTNAVLVAISRAIGLGEVVDRPLEEELADRLRDQDMLFVLDNFEQVTEAAGAVARLLGDCPKLKILVTSREALHIRAERVHPVPPLSLPVAGSRPPTAKDIEGFEAVQLFVERAGAARPDFHLSDDNAPAVAEICRRLDGLPLAIELAAARLRLFSPEGLQDQLRNRLRVLSSGPRDLPERQQTLRAAMDWSYELLTPGEQRLFAVLAVFADADIAAIEMLAEEIHAVDGLDLDVLDGLSSLIEKSLVRATEQPHHEQRLSMLETIRDFAAERLDQQPDVSARVRQAHATYYADFASRLQRDLSGGRRADALEALTTEVGNLRLAWRYWVNADNLDQLDKLADSMLILNDARGWYLDTVGLTSDMLAVLRTNTSSPAGTGKEISLRMSLARALMATKGVTPEVEDAFARTIELFERDTDAQQQFSVLRGLASLYQFRGQLDRGAELGQEIMALADRAHDPQMLVSALLLQATNLIFTDDLSGGLDLLDRAISILTTAAPQAFDGQAGGDPRVACYTTSAFALWLLGYPDKALERANRAIALAPKLDHPFTSAFAQFHVGLLHLWRREFAESLAHAETLLSIAGEHAFQVWTAAGTCLLGAAQAGLGHAEEGPANIRAGMDLYQGLRSPPIFWTLLLWLDAAGNYWAGKATDGVSPAEDSIEMMSPGRGTTLLPEVEMLRGDIALALAGGVTVGGREAEPWYRRAFDRAGEMGARMSQLRAASRLLSISRNDDERKVAMDDLDRIYATFTEGFATADLREAQVQLASVMQTE